MALTQISTGGIKDDAVTDTKLPANSVGNSEMKDDAVGVAELSATGTASSSTFLRGDNSWVTPTDTNTQLAFANDANNRVVTGDGSGGLNGEANLTFDGTTLSATGDVSLAGPLVLQPGGTAWNTTINRPQIQRQADGELRLGAGSDSSSIINFHTAASAGGTLTERMRITSAGSVYIGNTFSAHSEGDDLVVGGAGWRGMTIYGEGGGGVIQFGDDADNRAGQILYNHSDNSMLVRTAGNTTRVRIDSDGLKFNADTAAANALDDYEEGTFTPTVANGITNSTFNFQRGSYVKIGRQVIWQLQISITGGTAHNSHLSLGGLPFASNGTAANAYGGAVLNYQNNMFNKGEDITWHTGTGETLVKCYKQDGNILVGTDGAVDDITTEILLHGQYIV